MATFKLSIAKENLQISLKTLLENERFKHYDEIYKAKQNGVL